MSRKGISILPFAFIALAISLGIIFWSFYNVYYGSKYQMNVFEHSKLDTMRNEVEKGKKFLKESCIYSSHQSLFEHASEGGIMPPKGQSINTWICNAPRPPSVSKTKGCLEKYTKFYVNVYYNNYTVGLPIDIAKAPYKSAIYNISRGSVFRGKYDEGNINVLMNGAKVSLSSDNLQITDNLNQNEVIDKNRFWYLWRKFYKWAQKNVYGKGICKCTSKCKGCDCVGQVAEKALDDLQKRFDEYVSCQKSCDCCYGCQGSDCDVDKKASCGVYCNPSKCLPWRQKECISKCNKKCADPQDRYPSAGNVSKLTDIFGKDYFEIGSELELGGTKSEYERATSESDSDEEGEDCCPVYKANKLSAVHTYSCTDKKYYVPTSGGPEPMTFQVKVSASFLDKDGCGETVVCDPCPCPQNK